MRRHATGLGASQRFPTHQTAVERDHSEDPVEALAVFGRPGRPHAGPDPALLTVLAGLRLLDVVGHRGRSMRQGHIVSATACSGGDG
jgi:hypothetical protein